VGVRISQCTGESSGRLRRGGPCAALRLSSWSSWEDRFERAKAAQTGRPGYDPRELLKLNCCAENILVRPRMFERGQHIAWFCFYGFFLES
jgi:hypothetical protein